MNEYDNTPQEDVYEEANFLSQAFDIDIYVLESSKNSFHAVSLDILHANTVERIQQWGTLPTNYMTLKESPLFGRTHPYNVLRIGAKATKQPPSFLRLFQSKGQPRLKSLQHYVFYRHLGIPEVPAELLVNLSAKISVYNSGIGAKPKRKEPF